MPSRGSPPRKRARALLAVAVVATLFWALSVAAAPPRKTPPKAAPPTEPAPPAQEPLLPLVDPDWRQIMMAPAITGNLRAVAVDPTDEKNIYVATQEGTLAHSTDGGITWAEISLSPFQARSPTTSLSAPGDESKQVDINIWAGGYGAPYIDRFHPYNRESAYTDTGQAPPQFANTLTRAWRNGADYPSAASSLLESIAGADPIPHDEIVYIAVCPGGANTLFVATARRLLGSSDGTNFVELLQARDDAPFQQLACNPVDPSEVVVVSYDGTYRSTDGGYTFETIGQVPATSVLFSPPLQDGTSLLFLVAGSELWIGRSSEPDNMEPVPTGEGYVNSVTLTVNSLWVATDMGIRVSRDLGQTWEIIEALEGYNWLKVAVTGGVDGPEQVVALREEEAYLSTDGGVSFHPTFRGESRRRLRFALGLPTEPGGTPGLLILTSGELWTTRPNGQPDPKLADVRVMAFRRLKEMPKLADLLDRALVKANLTDEQLDSLVRRWKSRGWLPGVHVNFETRQLNVLTRTATSISAPSNRVELEPELFFDLGVSLTWELPDIGVPNDLVYKRMDLYDVRKRLSFFIEDAYAERRQILEQLAIGGVDEEQSLTLQARLEVLDVVFKEFTTERKH